MDTVNLICSLLLLGLTVYFLLDAAQRRGSLAALAAGSGEEPPLSRPWRLALWGLIGLFTLLRLYRSGSVPGGFNQDGAMAAVDALALAKHGTDRFGTWLPAHFTAWGYGQMSVLLSYCMAPLFRLFGMNSVTARLPMLLWSFGGMAASTGCCGESAPAEGRFWGCCFSPSAPGTSCRAAGRWTAISSPTAL